MKIALTKEEVADVIAAHISTIVDKTVLPHEIIFERYGDEFAVWDSLKEILPMTIAKED
jgi:hypothetical protein